MSPYKEHYAAAALDEAVGQVREGDAGGGDAVNKEDLFAVLGAEFVDSYRSVLQGGVSKTISAVATGEETANGCINVSGAGKLIRLVRQTFCIGFAQLGQHGAQRAVQDPGPSRPEDLAGEDEHRGRDEGGGRRDDGRRGHCVCGLAGERHCGGCGGGSGTLYKGKFLTELVLCERQDGSISGRANRGNDCDALVCDATTRRIGRGSLRQKGSSDGGRVSDGSWVRGDARQREPGQLKRDGQRTRLNSTHAVRRGDNGKMQKQGKEL